MYYENGKINNCDYALFVLREVWKFILNTQVLEMEDSYWINPRLVIRKEMAKDILGGELRVLRSASDWLKHHCDGLIHFQNISW